LILKIEKQKPTSSYFSELPDLTLKKTFIKIIIKIHSHNQFFKFEKQKETSSLIWNGYSMLLFQK